jgi:hypothetical protein
MTPPAAKVREGLDLLTEALRIARAKRERGEVEPVFSARSQWLLDRALAEWRDLITQAYTGHEVNLPQIMALSRRAQS